MGFEKSVFGAGKGGRGGIDMIGCVDRGSRALSNAISIASIQLLMSFLWAVESFGGVLLVPHKLVWSGADRDTTTRSTARSLQNSRMNPNFSSPSSVMSQL